MPSASSGGFTSSPPVSTAGHDPLPATSVHVAWPPPPRRLPSQFLRRHVQSFLRHMFPIWPVVRANKTLADCLDPDSLPLKRYCFLTALCAAASVQLNLESTPCELEVDGPADERHECYPRLTPDYLLSEVLRLRSTLDIAEQPDLDALLTSCFLFSAYANLERHNQAWFYLSQSISLALTLKLHDEQAYSRMAYDDAQLRRRIFWLLFILERYRVPARGGVLGSSPCVSLN